MIDVKSQVVDATAVCDNCGAELVPGRKKCWLCGINQSPAVEDREAKPISTAPNFARDEVKWNWLISIPIIGLVLFAIGFGCWQFHWLLGLSFAGIAGAAMAACLISFPLVAFHGPSETASRHSAKVGFTILGGIIGAILLVVSAVVMFFAVCFGVVMQS